MARVSLVRFTSQSTATSTRTEASSNASVVPHDETQKNRCPGYLQLFSINPHQTEHSHSVNPLSLGPHSFPGNSIRPSICDPFSGNKRCHSASRGSVKRRVLGERMEEERTEDGWAGYAGTGGRLTIVSGQEGGHRGPDTRPGNDRRADREGGRRKERDRQRHNSRPMRAMQFPAGPSVCAVVHATYAIVPLPPLPSPPSFSHTKVNIPAIRMEYNTILSG